MKIIYNWIKNLLRDKVYPLIKGLFWIVLILSIAVTLITEIYSDISNSWNQEIPNTPESFTIYGIGLAILAPLILIPSQLSIYQKQLLRSYLGFGASLIFTGLLYLFGKQNSSFIVHLGLREVIIGLYVLYILISLFFGSWNFYKGIKRLYEETNL